MIKELKVIYNERSPEKIQVLRNVGMSFLAKSIALAVNFATVPLLLSLLGKDTYGVWLTIFSVLSWMTFFDLGLGNGLRNYLTIAFAKGNFRTAQQYVSTAYWVLGPPLLFFLGILQFISFFIDWNAVFKPEGTLNEDLHPIISICLWGFGFLLMTRLINSILQSQKRVGTGSLLLTLGNGLSLILLFVIFRKDSSAELYQVAYIFSWATPTVLLLYSIYFFKTKNSFLLPRFRNIEKSLAKNIFGLGFGFFVAQFLVLILNQSSNFIITQTLTPSQVPIYYIPLRLFSIISITIGLISSNLLPYFTEANSNNDIQKMKRILKKFFRVLGLVTVISIFILFFSKSIISFWTADQLKIPFVLLSLHLFLALITGVNGIFGAFLNGIGKIKPQIPVFFGAVAIFIPLAIYLADKIGLNGIAVATIVAQLIILLSFARITIKEFNSKNHVTANSTIGLEN